MGKAWGADTVGELDGLLADGAAVVAGLRDLPWWRLGEDRLLAATDQVEALLRSAFGVQVRLAAELELRGVAKAHSVSSTAKLLAQRLSITPGEARGRVLAGQAILVPEASAEQVACSQTDPDTGARVELPELSAAVDAGAVGSDHSRVIITAMRGIPAKVDPALRDMCERVLVAAARDRDANRLRDVAEQIRNITDPDGSLNDVDATDRVELSIGSRRGDGLTPFRGLLDDLGIEWLRQAVEPLARPRPAGPDLPDPRPAGVRRGQALAEVCRRFLNAGVGPSSGGVRPHATVTVALADLAAGRGVANLDFVGSVSARVARLLTCDAEVQPLVLGSQDLPLQAWAKTRLFPPVLRRVLAVRDGAGCAWPGCDQPVGWCDAHHIVFWADGGATVAENGVLLCGFHHTEVHRGRWVCRMGADGRPEFIPPRWLDPTQRPRRNHLFVGVALDSPSDDAAGRMLPDDGADATPPERAGLGDESAGSTGNRPRSLRPRTAGLRRGAPGFGVPGRQSSSGSRTPGRPGDRPVRIPRRWLEAEPGSASAFWARPSQLPKRSRPHRDDRSRPRMDLIWSGPRTGLSITMHRQN